jgi:hypothetical protein
VNFAEMGIALILAGVSWIIAGIVLRLTWLRRARADEGNWEQYGAMTAGLSDEPASDSASSRDGWAAESSRAPRRRRFM